MILDLLIFLLLKSNKLLKYYGKLERRAKTTVLAFFNVVAIYQIFPQLNYKSN